MRAAEKRAIVTAKLKKKNYPKLLARAWEIYNAWVENAAELPAPAPSLTVFLALLQAFDTAQHQAKRDRLLIETRNAKAFAVISAIEAWEALLQGACDADQARAGQMIAAGSMFHRGTGKRTKALLALALVPGEPGTVAAKANASLLMAGSQKRPTFNWQTSSDAGTTITNAASTPHAATRFTNVPLLSTLYVRVSVTLGNTTGEWSQWVSVFVH